MVKKFFYALAILVGTVVGAGIFGLPYVISKSGILPGFFYLLILGGVVLFLHLLFGEIVLRTQEKHRLIGYSQKYLGNWGKFLITISTFLGIVGALLAYLILAGNFLKIIFFPLLNLSSFHFSLFFLFLFSFFIFRGIKLIAPLELLLDVFFFLIIFLIVIFALPQINLENFILFDFSHLFLPYGVILFAFLGTAAIPEISEILKEFPERKKYPQVIILASFLVFFLYLIFSFAVIGVSGKDTSPEVFSGLLPFLGEKIVILGSIFGLIVVATSFLVLANYLKNSLIYDYFFPKILAKILTLVLPLILFLIGFRNFIETIGFVGTFLGTIEGIVIVLLFQRAKKLGDKKPEYSLQIPSLLLYFLIIVFLFGVLSQIIYFNL